MSCLFNKCVNIDICGMSFEFNISFRFNSDIFSFLNIIWDGFASLRILALSIQGPYMIMISLMYLIKRAKPVESPSIRVSSSSLGPEGCISFS